MVGQITSGWRSVFSIPAAYRLAQSCIGASRVRQALVDEYLQTEPEQRVLDIGCGTGDLAGLLADCSYVGFDLSPEYIEAARARYGHIAEFHVGAVEDWPLLDRGYDRTVAQGVLHHLSDPDARALFDSAFKSLSVGGRLVTIDPCFVSGQSRIARSLASRDRGRHVRTPSEYVALARTRFREVTVEVRDDLLRVPYTHSILTCVKDG